MSDIRLNVSRLNDYANRIANVNSRISSLDRRIRSLYNQFGLLDLWNLIRVDSLTSYSERLRRCQSYLEQTASDFQKNEEALLSYNAIDFEQINTILLGSIGLLNTLGNAISSYDATKTDSPDNDLSDCDLLSYYIDDYKKILFGDGSAIEKKDAAIKYFSKIRKRVSYGKEIYLWANNIDKLNLPVIDDGLKFIKYIDMGNKTITGIYEFLNGAINGDSVLTTEGSEKLLGVTASLIKGSETVKSFGTAKSFFAGLGIDYVKNMAINFTKSSQENTEISEIIWDTFATSAFDTGIDMYEDYVYNEVTLSVAYPFTKKLTSLFGYDLDAAYLEATGETGINGAVSGFKELTGIIREESSWENWCSGMAIIGNGIKKGWNNFWGSIFK